MKDEINTTKEQWDFIFKIFPLIDLPFNLIAIYTSDNWVITLILAMVFPIVASIFLLLSQKMSFQPGVPIFCINGVVFIIYVLVSGHNSPTWLSLINMTVGSSFIFRNPRIGQVIVTIISCITGLLFYFMGATPVYSVTIVFILLAFVLLFSRAYAYMQLQQSRIVIKNKEIEIKQKDITDSIHYAKRIQYAVLPNEESIYRNIPLSFIFYKPKDIVSGDFFWFHQISKEEYIFVCADCTGHGVPGAFMTVIGSSLLNQIIIDSKITQPSEILLELDRQINFTLKQQKDFEYSVQDGMDLSIIKVNKSTNTLLTTSAKRPSLFISNKTCFELKGSKNSIGGISFGKKEFKEQEVNFQEGDMLYLYTDGFADQFGGDKGKKYTTKRLKELLFELSTLPVSHQKTKIQNAFEEWRREYEQLDDVLVVGIKF